MEQVYQARAYWCQIINGRSLALRAELSGFSEYSATYDPRTLRFSRDFTTVTNSSDDYFRPQRLVFVTSDD